MGGEGSPDVPHHVVVVPHQVPVLLALQILTIIIIIIITIIIITSSLTTASLHHHLLRVRNELGVPHHGALHGLHHPPLLVFLRGVLK